MRKFLKFAPLGLAALLTLGASAFAQEGSEFVAKIPFNFTVGQQHLPAGKYTLLADGNRLTIRTPDGTNAALLWANREPRFGNNDRNSIHFEKGDAGLYHFAGVDIVGKDFEWHVAKNPQNSHVEAYEVNRGK